MKTDRYPLWFELIVTGLLLIGCAVMVIGILGLIDNLRGLVL